MALESADPVLVAQGSGQASAELESAVPGSALESAAA
jgi:hypothetical protein